MEEEEEEEEEDEEEWNVQDEEMSLAMVAIWQYDHPYNGKRSCKIS